MAFPLADWILAHPGCRHDLARSGMFGSIRHPSPSAADVRGADPEELRHALADHVGVAPRRLFLTPGATEANAAVLLHLARSERGGSRRARVLYPEYPPLFDIARLAGFRPSERPGRAAVAVVSRPRNPEGDLWSVDRLTHWASGARHLLVDETFREFADAPSLAERGGLRCWATGSFTKFYAGDDIRVGFVIAPEELASGFARFHGLVADPLPPYSVATALVTLHDRARIRREVHRILDASREAWRAQFPDQPVPLAPVAFDRPAGVDSRALGQACLRSSVLVCPGGYFGDSSGVRLCLTRRTFADDLRAYRVVRRRLEERARASRLRAPRGARPRRDGNGRARALPA